MPEEIRAYLKSIAGIAPDKTLWGVVGALARRVDDNIQAIKGQVQLSKDLMTRIDEVVAELKGVKDEIAQATAGRKSLGDVLSEIWGLKGDWWDNLIRNVNAALDLGEGFLSNLRAKIESAKELALSASSRIEALIDDVPSFERVHGIVTCLADGVKSKVQTYLNDVREFWQAVREKSKLIKSAISNFVSKFREALTSAVGSIGDGLSEAVDSVTSLYSDIKTAVTALWGVSKDALKEGAKVFEVVHGTKRTITAHYKKRVQVLPGVYEDIEIGPWSWSRYEELKTVDLAEFLKEWLPGYMRAMLQILGTLISAIVHKISQAFTNATQRISSTKAELSNDLAGFVSTVQSTIKGYIIPDIPTPWTGDGGMPEFELGDYVRRCVGGA